MDLGTAWRSSGAINGSPGATDPQSLVGDLDGDQRTSRADVVRLLQNFGLAIGSDRSLGDVNHDGATNLVDLALVQTHLGESVSESPALAAQADSIVDTIDVVFDSHSPHSDQILHPTNRVRRAIRTQRRNSISEQRDAPQSTTTSRIERDLSTTSLRARRGRHRLSPSLTENTLEMVKRRN